MLRITEFDEGEAEVRLKLEGKLREPWVAELARVSSGVERPIHLDLQAVTFVDEAGLSLLRRLVRQGALVNASAFVTELLRREDR